MAKEGIYANSFSRSTAAQKSDKPTTSTKSWIVTTTLPAAYRTPAIIPPTKAPSTSTESTYTALYSFIIAVISLNGGSLGEQKLMRYLRRMNADDYTPIDKTDKLLARLCKEGYLVRTREMDGGEEVIEFMVGPRGKMEVGSGGAAGLVREVYGRGRGSREGGATQAERELRADFEARLRRSLGITAAREEEQEEEEEERGQQREEPRTVNGRGAGEASRNARPSEAPRRSSRRATTAQESEEEEESSSEESGTENEMVKDETD